MPTERDVVDQGDRKLRRPKKEQQRELADNRPVIRIGVCTVASGPFRRVWSGTPAHLVDAMRRSSDVEVHVLTPKHRFVYKVLNLISAVSGRLFRHRVNWEVEPRALALFTAMLRRQWQHLELDAVIAMGWMPWDLKEDDPAVIYWGDASMMQRVDRAPHWSDLVGRTRRLIPTTERRAIHAVDATIMPSDWAIKDLHVRYEVPESKLHRVPFGANIEDPGPIKRSSPRPSHVRLLCVGVEWERKGLDIAVGAADVLAASGIEVQLDIVGSQPPSNQWLRSYIHYWGFLSKTLPRDVATLSSLFRDTDVFVLPSRSDPSPMVIGEAGAYSLPVVASAVDGIPERLVGGGLLLPSGSDARDYARAILEVVKPDTYEAYAAASRADYEQRSDWDTHVPAILAVCRAAMRSATDRTRRS